MSAARNDSGSRGARDDAAPAEALSDVWVLLDELPRGAASADLTATTIEMAAVTGDTDRGAATLAAAARRWLAPAAVVTAALVAGAVAGRLTAPDPDQRLLDHLPLVRHFDVLREAGSVTFLEEVAGRGGPPLRLVLRQGPAAARQDATDYTAALDSLGLLLRADDAARRRVVDELPVDERAELERSLRRFAALSGAERKTLAAVAEALVDPARPELRAAALDWHRWIASSRPEDRADIVASGTDKRLDWIDWYAARIEGRGRPGSPDRPPGARRPPGFEPPRPPDGRFRRPPPRGEGPEPRAAPRSVSPDESAPPPETRAPPG
jgi:hypothetical protein